MHSRLNNHSETEPGNVLSESNLKRADLHCHTRYSVFKYFRRANTRDCYNAPEDVYRIAKERGMSYVTFTDHDSIDGALYMLNKYPELEDFFIGEEVETYFPETGQRIHVGVWGLDETQHREIQKLRRNIRELVPYLKSQRLVFGVNHLFQNYRMKNVAARYVAELIEMFDVYEVLNGAMASFHNKMVQQLVETIKEHGRRASMVGGSDAHTLKHVAKVHTVSKGTTPAEFIENIRAGDCFAWGAEMRFRELVADIYLLTLAYQSEARSDFLSSEYSPMDKTIQLAGRLASIPTAISGLPAAITSLNYLKQIVVTKGISMRFEKLVDEIRPGLMGER
jgi:predicted metal-dependent phosphoesterase TrpH